MPFDTSTEQLFSGLESYRYHFRKYSQDCAKPSGVHDLQPTAINPVPAYQKYSEDSYSDLSDKLRKAERLYLPLAFP